MPGIYERLREIKKQIHAQLLTLYTTIIKPKHEIYNEVICAEVKKLLEKRKGPKIQIERLLRDCCSFIYYYRQDLRGVKLHDKLIYETQTWTHIGAGAAYANENQIFEYVSDALQMLKNALADPDSDTLNRLEHDLDGACMEARLVDALGILNYKSGNGNRPGNANDPAVAQFKTKGGDLIATLLNQEFYNQNIPGWTATSSANIGAAASASGANPKLASEAAAVVSERSPDNKDYINFILSRLANAINYLEVREDTRGMVEEIAMTGLGTDLASLNEIYKKGYLKIPDLFFVRKDSRDSLISAILDFYIVPVEDAVKLHDMLYKVPIELLQAKLRVLQPSGTVRSRKQRRVTRKQHQRK